MQERWQILMNRFQNDLSSEDYPFLYLQARLLHAVALQLQYHPKVGKKVVSVLFQDVIKRLSEKLLSLSKQSADKKIHTDFGNFLHQIHNTWELEGLPYSNSRLWKSYQYQNGLLENWDNLGCSTAEDFDCLFGQIYGYGVMLQQEIALGKTDYTDVERITALLNTALSLLSRRLSLLSEQMRGCTEEELKRLTSTFDDLINWRMAQGNLTELERKDILYYAHATFLYQSRLLRPFNNLEAAQTDFDSIKENYAPGSLLKRQRMVVWLDRINRDFSKRCILNKDLLDRLLAIWQETPLVALSESYQNLKSTLFKNRAVFQKAHVSFFQPQRFYSKANRALMQTMLDNSIHLLGIPPCQIGLLLLGSSSRSDRLPYSDIELALLYEPLTPEQKLETNHYIAGFIALMELQIIHLGESGKACQGVWLDSSTSFRSHPHLRGSPEQVLQKGIVKKQWDIREAIPKDKNPRNLKLHSFLYDPSAYSLMQPLLVNTNYGGRILYKRYQAKLQAYLDDQPDEKLLAELCDLVHPDLKQKLTPTHFTNRQMMALWVWWDVLRCLPDHLTSLKDQSVDLKKVYHKPFAYFVLGLRLYYNLSAKNLEETLQQAKDQQYLSPPLANFLMTALEWVIKLRITNHLRAEKQDETLSLVLLTPEDQWHLCYFPELFRMMQAAVEYFLAYSEEFPNTIFDLHQVVLRYFQQTLTIDLNTKKAYAQWFTDVTGYLLYTQEPLELNHYYYRLIPEAHRQASLKAAQAFFGDLKKTCSNVRYWKSEAGFWEQLWEGLPESTNIPKNWLGDSQNAENQLAGLSESKPKLDEALNELKKGNLEQWSQLSQKEQSQLLVKLDWSTLTPPIQKELLKALTDQGHCQRLIVNQSSKLNDERFGKLLQKNPQIVQLSLKQCVNVSEAFLSQLPQPDCTLVQIWLSHLPELKSIGHQGGTFTSEFCVLLPYLENFTMKHCNNVSEIYIKAPLLKTLTVFFSPELELKRLRTQSKQLMSVDVQGLKSFPLSEWRSVMDEAYGYQLQRVQWRGSGIAELGWLIEMVPILMTFPWGSYPPALIEQYAHYCYKAWRHVSPKAYLAVSPELRSQCLNQTQTLLDDYQTDFDRIRELVRALRNALKNKYANVRQSAAGALGQLQEATPAVIKALVKALGDKDPAVRQAVGGALSRLQEAMRDVIEALLKALQNKEWCVRQSAAGALGQLQEATLNVNVFDALVDALLRDEEWKVRQAAADALGRLQKTKPAVIEALLKALGDEEWKVRQAAADALGRLQKTTPAVIEALVNALRDEDSDVRQSAAGALGRLQKTTPAVIEALVNALRDEDSNVRQSTAGALSQLQRAKPKVIKALVEALGDKEYYVRQSAADALGRLQRAKPKVIKALLKALEDEEWCIRQSAADALGRLQEGGSDVIEALLKALGDEYANVRQSAIGALGRFQEAKPDVIKALLKVLRNKNEHHLVRQSVADALGRLQEVGSDVIEALLKALGDEAFDVRQSAASALGRLQKARPAVIKALLKALGDGDSDVRQSAAGALGQLQEAMPDVVEALLRALADKESSVRQSAAGALGQLQERMQAMIGALLKALENKDEIPLVRESAAGVLGQLQEAKLAVIEALLKALGDEEWYVRQSAAGALGHLQEARPAVIEVLLKALENKDETPLVRESAAGVLGQLQEAKPAVIEALLKALGDKYANVLQSAAGALGQLGQFLQEQIHQRMDTYTKAWQMTLKEASVPLFLKTSERSIQLFTRFFGEKNTYNDQGKLIASYLDRSDCDAMACVNRAFSSFFSQLSSQSCHDSQVDIEKERVESKKN